MLVVLSPAKTFNFTIMRKVLIPTTPEFVIQAEKLVTSTLSKMSTSKLGTTLSISTNLANLNAARYSNFHHGNNARPTQHQDDVAACAVTAYAGRAWKGLDQASLTDTELLYCADHLRILSGLYGIVKPTDIIQPYRLDMGTKLVVSKEHSNLYSYWGDALKRSLLASNASVIVNVASGEYWKACLEKELSSSTHVLTVSFREGQGKSARVIAVHAKLARGLFVRFMCQTEPETVDELKAFDGGGIGYSFDDKLSNDNLMVFTRSNASTGSSSSSGAKKEKNAKKRSGNGNGSDSSMHSSSSAAKKKRKK
jgi:uncharacterized protein